MEFRDVVMRRRAVRRLKEGGVDREVLERIATLVPTAVYRRGSATRRAPVGGRSATPSAAV